MAPSSGRLEYDIVASLATLIFILQFDRGGGFSMLSRDQLFVMNAGDHIELDCEFYMSYFNLFDNPVLWVKSQYHEQSRINIMGNINEPFVSAKRFNVQFLPAPPRYRLVLSVRGLSIDDSGNYTCEVRGQDTVVLGYTTHQLFIRDPVQVLTLNKDNCSGSGRCDFATPSSLSFTENIPSLLQCVATGGNPPPDLQIFLDDFDITYRFEREIYTSLLGAKGLRIMQSSVHTRTANLVLQADDDGKTLSCRATVAGLPNNITSTRVKVKYRPTITCTTGQARINHRNVHISCIVKGRPRPISIMWFIDDNGTIITEGKVENEHWQIERDLSDGSIRSSLFMRIARPEYFRKYKILAENIVGKSYADVELLQNYGPDDSKVEDDYYNVDNTIDGAQEQIDYIFVRSENAADIPKSSCTLAMLTFHVIYIIL